jgi:hypothetical protein
MDKRATFLRELQGLCEDLMVHPDSVAGELMELIGAEEIVDYYIVRGPGPGRAETVADAFILSEECLYSCEVSRRGPVFQMAPLVVIRQISEDYSEVDGQEFISISFSCGGSSLSTVVQDKRGNAQRLRRFSRAVKNALIQRLGEIRPGAWDLRAHHVIPSGEWPPFGWEDRISFEAGGEVNESVVLAVGQETHLKHGKDRIVYAGMPSDNVYSIVQRKASGYQGYAWNLFFAKRQRDTTIDGVRITVENVTPEEIRLRIE